MRALASEKPAWRFARGHEIAPGRTALKPLGGGSRCEVYLVWDERRRTTMVAKVLRPDLVEDEQALRALRREHRALEALAHPVLLRVFDAHFDGPHPHLLVEHLEGPTLRKLLRQRGALPLSRTLPLALSVASAIHHVAEEGWLHLDLKPGNIVMGDTPRVIDLGLARTIESAKRLTGFTGTNAYVAPEQCSPRGEVGPPADVWGLGATLYQAVSGRLPFAPPRTRDREAPLEDRFPQLEDAPRPWAAPVRAGISEAILACLEKDPARRPTAAELTELLQPLAREAAGTGRARGLYRGA